MFKSHVLKIALFATGLAGIVAEYVLSTLATYFLGNAVLQWTLIVSMMLFSMGLGSRISKVFKENLLKKFILIELTLSFFSAFSALLVYTIAAYTPYTGIIIYLLCIIIGLLIGMEIPLVIRLNSNYQILKVNVSSVLEQDYYGSLAGGLFFAFVGLPILGLTYTPFILGSMNFLVAVGLIAILWKEISQKIKSQLSLATSAIGSFLLIGFFIAQPLILFGEQRRYQDKIIYSEQTKYQKIVLTQWKDDYWLYINNNQQLSTIDEVMYHEPLVHPVMNLHPNPSNVLVLGGGDGCAVRELLKYPEVRKITLVDIDPKMTQLSQNHPVLTQLNTFSLNNEKVEIKNEDAFIFIEKTKEFYDVVIVDLPDPKTVDLNQLYTKEFYSLIHRKLRPEGLLITQAGSPYFATQAYLCIEQTMAAAGFNTQKIHNQIVTLGEWGWVIGSTNHSIDLKQQLRNLHFDRIETKWVNNEAMFLMTSFGKTIYLDEVNPVEVNQIHNPVLYRYYLKGNWDLY
ncbi:MAG: polyamine aminopropyltransferase [Bacteroidota bacterium]